MKIRQMTVLKEGRPVTTIGKAWVRGEKKNLLDHLLKCGPLEINCSSW